MHETLAADIPLAADHFPATSPAQSAAEEGRIFEIDKDTIAYHFDEEQLGVVGQIIPFPTSRS